MIAVYDGGGAATRLWCVELVPKKKRLSEADLQRAVELAKSMPRDPNHVLAWVALIADGLVDERQPLFARERRRLVVFKQRRRASAFARKETNEFWTGNVRVVRVV